MKSAIKYYKTVREELLKVVFPVKEQIRNAFFSVVIVVTVIAVFLAIIDFILHNIVYGIIS